MENREIKFRAFRKNENWMYEVFSFCKDYVKATIGDGMINKYPIEDFEPLMQFTGLKDKNGIDIYEGDIVNFCNNNNVTVVFENGSFCVFDEPLGWDFDVERHPVKTDFNYCTVVGNIHENPELLNK